MGNILTHNPLIHDAADWTGVPHGLWQCLLTGGYSLVPDQLHSSWHVSTISTKWLESMLSRPCTCAAGEHFYCWKNSQYETATVKFGWLRRWHGWTLSRCSTWAPSCSKTVVSSWLLGRWRNREWSYCSRPCVFVRKYRSVPLGPRTSFNLKSASKCPDLLSALAPRFNRQKWDILLPRSRK